MNFTQVCKTCGIEKPFDGFYSAKTCKTGFRGTCKACHTAEGKKWRALNRKVAASHQLKYLYGITVEDYNRMYADQNGLCKICGTSDPGRRNKRFHVDHDHTTGRVRGLLCFACNRTLGSVKDNTEILRTMISYLDAK